MIERSKKTPQEISNELDFEYTKQIVICFFDGKYWSALQPKWTKKHAVKDYFTISDVDFLTERYQPPKINSDDIVRIYICAHGQMADGDIRNDDSTYIISAAIIAEKLVPLIQGKQVVVNLIVCQGGRSQEDIKTDNGLLSFAALLQDHLYKLTQRNVIVIARMHDVFTLISWLAQITGYKGAKLTLDLTISPSEAAKLTFAQMKQNLADKQPGSKVAFYNDNEGNQIKVDVYYHQWKNKVIQALKKHLPHRPHYNLLNSWIAKFEKQTFEEIKYTLEQELHNPKSILRSQGRFKLFNPKNIFKDLKKLLEQADEIAASEFTIKDAMISRKGNKAP